ncbi:MAG: type I phosphomannose isomerase catalytic subunit [Christensenellaceae bacterium]
MLYPLILTPVFKEYLWGGTRLKQLYNKVTDFEKIAESWELSTHRDGVCGIENGYFAGRMFTEYLQSAGLQVLGTNAKTDELPVLIKYIDSSSGLSVQVHPDDAYARRQGEPYGKTEFWYIVDCGPDAWLYYGTEEGTEFTKEEFIRRAKDGSIVDLLKKVPVKKGDAFYIEPGTVHAIGKDMTVVEVGTNCNITYRIFDFNRTDKDGNARPLHLEDAAAIIKPGAGSQQWENGRIDCSDFVVTELRVNGILDLLCDERSFHCLMCIEGNVMIDRAVQMNPGSTVFIPAGLGGYTLRGEGTVLAVSI